MYSGDRDGVDDDGDDSDSDDDDDDDDDNNNDDDDGNDDDDDSDSDDDDSDSDDDEYDLLWIANVVRLERAASRDELMLLRINHDDITVDPVVDTLPGLGACNMISSS